MEQTGRTRADEVAAAVTPVIRGARAAKAEDRPDERPDVSADDSDTGWGERTKDSSRDEWYRRERPPHHGD